MEKLTAFIFARGGSKRVPQKNIAVVGGKPLIAHSIAAGLASKSVGRIVVSTDDAAIAKVAKQYGAEVLERPPELAADTSPELLAWRHAIDSHPELFTRENPQPFISLPTTSPLRAPDDIDAAIAKFREGNCDVLFGISPSHNSPYLSMVTIGKDDLISIAMSGSSAIRTQDTPPVYDITTCTYVANPTYVQTCKKLIDGRVGYIMIPPERALDIDTSFDMHLADLLLTHPFKGEN